MPYISLHPISPFSLLLLFSKRLCRFSSLSRASSSSCCCRHLWKFSTTTPTNMLSTKKLTMRRKEMKNSSIQGSWFLFGYREARGGWGGVRSDKRGWGKRRWGESTNKTMQILSQQEHCQLTSMYLPAFFPIHILSPKKIFRSYLKLASSMLPETGVKQIQKHNQMPQFTK